MLSSERIIPEGVAEVSKVVAVLRKHPQLRTEEDLGLLDGAVEALRAALLT